MWTGNILHNFNFPTVFKLKVSFLELNGGGKEQRNRSFNGGKKEHNTRTHKTYSIIKVRGKKGDLHENVNKEGKIAGLNRVHEIINTFFVLLKVGKDVAVCARRHTGGMVHELH